MNYLGKTVLITGAGSETGKAVAKMFAMEGAYVLSCDVAAAKAKETAEEIRIADGKAWDFAFDVSDEAQVVKAVTGIIKDFNAVDILVNAAGVAQTGSVEEISEKQWDKVLAVNLKGAFLMCKALVPSMKEQKKGCIVNITAAAGGDFASAGGNCVAAQGGILAFTIHLARQLKPFCIRVNAINSAGKPAFTGSAEGPGLSGGTLDKTSRSSPFA